MPKQTFLGITVGLFVLGMSAGGAEPEIDQKQALAAVKNAGGEIKRDDSSPRKPVIGITFGCGSGVTDADLLLLKNFFDLQELSLHSHDVTDQGMEQLKSLPHLKSLMLIRVRVTDKGLDHLKGLTSLRQVYIRFTGITQEGARELGKALPEAKITWKP